MKIANLLVLLLIFAMAVAAADNTKSASAKESQKSLQDPELLEFLDRGFPAIQEEEKPVIPVIKEVVHACGCHSRCVTTVKTFVPNPKFIAACEKIRRIFAGNVPSSNFAVIDLSSDK